MKEMRARRRYTHAFQAKMSSARKSMSEKYFKEYFWRYPKVVITDIKIKTLVFDERIFFSEAKKLLYAFFSNKKSAESHFIAFQSYLVSNVAVSGLVERVNTAMRLMYQNIMNGNDTLNENTKFAFSGKSATEALEGIFTAYHDTSLCNDKSGRFDVSVNPLSYEDDNLIIRLTYYNKFGVMTKLLKKDLPIAKEELIESKRINKISGDSNGMIVSLFDGQAFLEITPFSTKWIQPQ